MRTSLREALPGAPAQQTSILHITLARLAGGAAAASSPTSRRAVAAACSAATEQLRGEQFGIEEVIKYGNPAAECTVSVKCTILFACAR